MDPCKCVPDCNNLYVPCVLRRAEVNTCDCSKFTTEMWIGSDELRVWIGRNMKVAVASVSRMAE
eukprot:28455-Pelagomonas_calceolata.AAC.1